MLFDSPLLHTAPGTLKSMQRTLKAPLKSMQGSLKALLHVRGEQAGLSLGTAQEGFQADLWRRK